MKPVTVSVAFRAWLTVQVLVPDDADPADNTALSPLRARAEIEAETGAAVTEILAMEVEVNDRRSA